LARAEVSSLQSVKVNAEGRLDGFEEFATEMPNRGNDAATVLVAHLFELLAAFIGEALTYRLVREAWPELSPDE
jgi:hypothetical protein